MTDGFLNELPERPNLEHLKKQAKRLLSDYRQRDPAAEMVVKEYERDPSPERFQLQDAQRVLARSYGFSSWPRLKEKIAIEAIKNGDTENLRAVIKQSSDPAKLFSTGIGTRNPTVHCFGKDATLLQFATFRSWKGEAAQTLIDAGADIDLHSACGLGLVDVIREHINADASAFEQQVDTYYPLQFAIAAGKAESVRALIQNGDQVNRTIRKVGWFDWEDDALQAGPPDWLPVHMSAIWGFDAEHVEVAKCLHAFGADLNAPSPLDGARPIHLASIYNRSDMIRFYVANGVDVDSRSVNRSDAIDVEGAKLPEPAGGHDWTPLMVNLGEGFQESAECLLELGADVNATNSMGRTPLHIAAGGFWKEREDIYAKLVQLLLERGASATVKDESGRLPIDFARQKQYDSIIALFG